MKQTSKETDRKKWGFAGTSPCESCLFSPKISECTFLHEVFDAARNMSKHQVLLSSASRELFHKKYIQIDVISVTSDLVERRKENE